MNRGKYDFSGLASACHSLCNGESQTTFQLYSILCKQTSSSSAGAVSAVVVCSALVGTDAGKRYRSLFSRFYACQCLQQCCSVGDDGNKIRENSKRHLNLCTFTSSGILRLYYHIILCCCNILATTYLKSVPSGQTRFFGFGKCLDGVVSPAVLETAMHRTCGAISRCL